MRMGFAVRANEAIDAKRSVVRLVAEIATIKENLSRPP